jgi:hypothetical protein
MIDFTAEPPISLAAAAKLIPAARSGKRTHVSTLIRWIRIGAAAPNGTRVRLEAARLGSRWMTSAAALQRFSQKLTPRLDDNEAAPTVRTATRRQAANERADAELSRLGL